MFDLELKIKEWSDTLRDKGKFLHQDIVELESHLRDEIDSLTKKDLTEEESFIIAVKRLGNSEILSKEYGKVNTDIIWKDLIFYDEDNQNNKRIYKDILLLVLLSLLAGIFSKLPDFFGFPPLFKVKGSDGYFYGKIASLFFLPSITIFFIIKNFLKINNKEIIIASLTFLSSAVIIILMPMKEPFHTAGLIGLHLPLFLWGMVGIAYTGKEWNTVKQKMNFIRFSGESFIYGTLLICGVLVLSIFTIEIFKEAKLNIEYFYTNNIMIFFIFAAPLIAVYLVEAKKSIVENIAPILAKIFSPLFLITMFVFLIIVLFSKIDPSSDRNFLIIFNFMLILVVGLVTYIISAKKNKEKINNYDYINFLLITVAMLIDIIALSAIITRISKYGFSANKTAALGENIILLGNLGGLAFFYIKFFIKKNNFFQLEKWQTFYLYIIFLWCGIVTFIFPFMFGFK